MYGPRSELVAAITFLRVGLRLSRCASTTAPMALSCGVSTACMCARRPSPDQRPRHVCRAAAYSGGCREVVARPRDNLALSLTARQPRPLGEVVARYRATTSPLSGGCRATRTARQPRPLGEVVARHRATTSPLSRVVARYLSRGTNLAPYGQRKKEPGCRAAARQPRDNLRYRLPRDKHGAAAGQERACAHTYTPWTRRKRVPLAR